MHSAVPGCIETGAKGLKEAVASGGLLCNRVGRFKGLEGVRFTLCAPSFKVMCAPSFAVS